MADTLPDIGRVFLFFFPNIYFTSQSTSRSSSALYVMTNHVSLEKLVL